MKSRLCSTFTLISKSVWRLLTESNYYGIYRRSGARLEPGLGLCEETITDMVLLEMSKRHPYDILTVKFSKKLEAQEGADWEWVILSASGILILRFQAKRIHKIGRDYEYSTLDYKSGGKYQVKTLIDKARAIGAIPLYMFYNFWDVDFPYWRYVRYISQEIRRCCGTWINNFGITIASAFAVKALREPFSKNLKFKKRLSDVLMVSWPLRCFGCCNYSDLTESMYRFINERLITSEDVRGEFNWEVRHPELPKAVLKRLEGEFEEDDPIFTSFIIDRDSPHKEGVEVIKQTFSL